MTAADRPLWLVCEDGHEYLARFVRFLGDDFAYRQVADAAALLDAAAEGGARGVVLDSDFRRTPPDRLVDEDGQSGAARDAGGRAVLAATQGLLILRALRRAGSPLRVLLFADLDDPEQVAFLTTTYGPLEVVPSHESLGTTALRMRRHPAPAR